MQRAIQWNFNFHELRRWAVEHGSIDVPFKWKDPTGDFSNEFAKWFHAQPTLFLQRRLTLDQV
jgi:protein gp37